MNSPPSLAILRAIHRQSAEAGSQPQIIAPRVELAGPGTVSHIVRRAFARAGIHPTSRGAAHLLRHSLATRMLRQGASMAEIAEILRHRSQTTTSIYAKVDFEALRGVAGAWPGTGGAR